jgi:hypothetical protein
MYPNGTDQKRKTTMTTTKKSGVKTPAQPAADFKGKIAAAAAKLTKKNPAAPKATAKKDEPKAPVAPAAAPVAPAPAASVVGQPDLGSKRLSQCALTEYRIVPSQRKIFKGYYLQGGTMSHDATRNADLFAVCVEIPHTDLAEAKKQLAELSAALKKAA